MHGTDWRHAAVGVRARGRLVVAGPRGFTLVELLVVIAIIGTLVGLLLPAVQSARESARRSTCGNNLKQIGLALANYESANKAFPAAFSFFSSSAGEPCWGWATFILPYMEQNQIFDGLDPKNRKLSTLYVASPTATDQQLLQTSISTYRCPSDTTDKLNTLKKFNSTSFGSDHFPLATSNYVGSAGGVLPPQNADDTGGLFSGAFDAKSSTPGYGPNGIQMKSITDGVSKTLAAGERGSFNLSAVWAGVGNNRYYDNHNIARTLGRPYFGINYDSDIVGGPENQGKGYGSSHPGGIQVVFCDGAVRFLPDTVTTTNIAVMANRNDKKVFDLP